MVVKRLFQRRTLQLLAALAAVGASAVLAYLEYWPFDASPRAVDGVRDPSVWQYLVGDRVTLGYARLTLVALAVYLLASVPALIVGGRWMKTVGTSGLGADEAEEVKETVQESKEVVDELTKKLDEAALEIDAVTKQRDEAIGVLRQIAKGSRSSQTRTDVSPIVEIDDDAPGQDDDDS